MGDDQAVGRKQKVRGGVAPARPLLQGCLFSTGLVPNEKVSLGFKGRTAQNHRLYRGVLHYTPINLAAGAEFVALVGRLRSGVVRKGTKFVQVRGKLSYAKGDSAARCALRLPEGVWRSDLDHVVAALATFRLDANGVLAVTLPGEISIRGCRVMYNRAEG